MKKIVFLVCMLCSVCLISCASTNKQGDRATDNISIGKVQKDIKIGMTSAEVVEVLGVPNMVTTDEERGV